MYTYIDLVVLLDVRSITGARAFLFVSRDDARGESRSRFIRYVIYESFEARSDTVQFEIRDFS